MPLDEDLGDAERKVRQDFQFGLTFFFFFDFSSKPCSDHIHFEIGPLGQIQDF